MKAFYFHLTMLLVHVCFKTLNKILVLITHVNLEVDNSTAISANIDCVHNTWCRSPTGQECPRWLEIPGTQNLEPCLAVKRQHWAFLTLVQTCIVATASFAVLVLVLCIHPVVLYLGLATHCVLWLLLCTGT